MFKNKSQSSFTNLTPDLACHICGTSFFMHYFTLNSQNQLKSVCDDRHVTCRWAPPLFDVWIKCCVIFKCSALCGPASAEQTVFSEKWVSAGLDVGGTITLRRMRGSRAYSRIWSVRQRSTTLMSDTLLTAITEGHIITQAIKVMLNTAIHHYHGAEAYSKHPSGSVRGQQEEETC